MQVKVRKPVKQTITTKSPFVGESHLSFGEMENLMNQAFGMKDFPMTSFVHTEEEQDGLTHEDLVLEPTPAVPGRPVTFQDFLPNTTPATVSVDNLKTQDLHKVQEDFPMYDTEEQRPQTISPLKDSEFQDMPIFTNFPMMKPGEFVQMDLDQELRENEGQSMSFFSLTPNNNNNNVIKLSNNDNNIINLNNNNAEYEDGEEIPSFTAFTESEFDDGDISKTRPAVLPPLTPPKDNLASLVNMVTEHGNIPEEIRLFRSPQSKGHPHHRYWNVLFIVQCTVLQFIVSGIIYYTVMDCM